MNQIARVILQNNEKKILLVKHKGKKSWILPGGHIEEGENIYKAIKREIDEELGVNIKILGKKNGLEIEGIKELSLPIAIYKINYKNDKGKEEKRLEYIFSASIKDDIIRTQINEIEEYRWFSKEEIIKLENTYPQVKELIKIAN